MLLLDDVVAVDPLDDRCLIHLIRLVLLHRFLLHRFLLQRFFLEELFLHLEELFLRLLRFDELLLLLKITDRRLEPERDRRRFLASGKASGAAIGSG